MTVHSAKRFESILTPAKQGRQTSRLRAASRRIVLGALAVLCTAAGGLVFTGASAFAAALPDGRAFEMVTPVEDRAADVYAPYVVAQRNVLIGVADIRTQLPFQASADGNAVAYVGDPTVSGQGETGLGAGDEFVARRLPGGGWTQSDISPPSERSAYYQAFSSDLSVGILQSGAHDELDSYEDPRLSEVGVSGSLSEEPEVPRGGYHFLYAHPATGSEGVYYPLFSSNPPDRSASAFGNKFGTAGVLPGYEFSDGELMFAGASASFQELLFEANDALAPGAVDGGPEANDLYLSVDGQPHVVNVLPDGVSEANASFGAPRERQEANLPDFSHAISADGSRVFWTDLAAGTYEDRVFLRENPSQPESPHDAAGRCTVPADACTAPVSEGSAKYWTATPDGRYVFYTEGEELWRFDAEGGAGHEREVLAGAGAGVQGVIGTSESGEYVYFVAQGVLASNVNGQGVAAEAGQYNLYVLHEGSGTRFIARLTEQDGGEAQGHALDRNYEKELGDWQPGLGYRTAEVTPDGSGLTFMSNDQAVGGYAPGLEEVYVYDYASDALSCASCIPSHAPPVASPVAEFEGKAGFLPVSWSNTYVPDWLSADGGRVVFDSSEPLVSQDTNGEPDVYEWERDGEGSCQLAAGCVFLLSGGTSPSGSWLGGESESGNDIFIISRDHLVEAGQGEEFAMYDARVGGVEPVAPPACTGTGCQGVPAPPPTFATPPSVTFSGVGNFPAPSSTVAPVEKVKAKPLTRAQKLAAALKACSRTKSGRRRAACEVRARRRYGASVKSKGSSERRGK